MVEKAAVREVWEETGLDVEIKELIGLFSEEGQAVMVAAYSAVELGGALTLGPETLDVGFFADCDLPPLAFPRDGQIWSRWRARNDRL